jgi:hypothetical protein
MTRQPSTRGTLCRASVGVPSLLILLMFVQGSLCGVPFYGAVPLGEALRLTWNWANLAESVNNDEVRREMPFVLPAVAAAGVWLFSRSDRWRVIGALAAFLLSGAVFLLAGDTVSEHLKVFVGMTRGAWPITAEMLSQSMDGESWDFVPYAAAAWWGGLWFIVLIAESILGLQRNAASARGFEPVVVAPSSETGAGHPRH